jgi:hypothetical protein
MEALERPTGLADGDMALLLLGQAHPLLLYKDSLRNNFPPLCRLRCLDATAKTGS